MATADKYVLVLTVDDKGTPTVKNFRKQVQATAKTTTAATKKMSAGFTSMWKSMLAGVGGILVLTRGIKELTAVTTEFQDEFANVTTLFDTSVVNAGAMQNAILDMGGELGSATEKTKALYQALSASVKPSESVQFVGDAAKLAKAGVASLADTVDLTTTIINAYGLEASEMTHISDVLFQVVKDGKITLQEMANDMGRLIPTANSMGIRLEEVSAALAILTKSGIKSTEAVTSINAALMGILKPSAETKKVMLELQATTKGLGFEFSKAGIEGAGGLQKWLEKLKIATNGNSEVLVKLFKNIRGLKALMTLTGSQAEAYAAQMDRMAHVAGNVDTAFKKQQATFTAVATAIKNDIGAALIKIAIPAFESLAIWLKDNRDAVIGFAVGLVKFGKDLLSVIGGVFGPAISVLLEFKDVLISAGKGFLVYWTAKKVIDIARAIKIFVGGIIALNGAMGVGVAPAALYAGAVGSTAVASGTANTAAFAYSTTLTSRQVPAFTIATGSAGGYAVALGGAASASTAAAGAAGAAGAAAIKTGGIFARIGATITGVFVALKAKAIAFMGTLRALPLAIKAALGVGIGVAIGYGLAAVFDSMGAAAGRAMDKIRELAVVERDAWEDIRMISRHGTDEVKKDLKEMRKALQASGVDADAQIIGLKQYFMTAINVTKERLKKTQKAWSDFWKNTTGDIVKAHKGIVDGIRVMTKKQREAIKKSQAAYEELAKSIGIITPTAIKKLKAEGAALVKFFDKNREQLESNEEAFNKLGGTAAVLMGKLLSVGEKVPPGMEKLTKVTKDYTKVTIAEMKAVTELELSHEQLDEIILKSAESTVKYDNKMKVTNKTMRETVRNTETATEKFYGLLDSVKSVVNGLNDMGIVNDKTADGINKVINWVGTAISMIGKLKAAWLALKSVLSAIIKVVAAVAKAFSAAVAAIAIVAAVIVSTVAGLIIGIGNAYKGWPTMFGNMINDFGDVTDEMKKKIKETAKEFKGLGNKWERYTAAISVHLVDIMKETDITVKRFDFFTQRLRDVLSDYDRGLLDVGQTTQILNDGFAELVRQAEKIGTLGSKKMFEFIADVKFRAARPEQFPDFVVPESVVNFLQQAEETGLQAYDKLNEIVNAQNQKQLDLLRQASEATNEDTKNELLAAAAEAAKLLEGMPGLDLDFFNQIKEQQELIASNTELTDYIENLQTVFESLSSVKVLDQTEFDQFSSAAQASFQALQDAGFSSLQAYDQMGDTFRRLIFLQSEFGLKIDDTTQAIIDQGIKSGELDLKGSATEQLTKATNELKDAIGKLTDEIAGGLNEGMSETETAGKNMFGELTAGADKYGNALDELAKKTTQIVPPGTAKIDGAPLPLIEEPENLANFARGGYIQVPNVTGFRNDGATIGVSPGEHVYVIPDAQHRNMFDKEPQPRAFGTLNVDQLIRRKRAENRQAAGGSGPEESFNPGGGGGLTIGEINVNMPAGNYGEPSEVAREIAPALLEEIRRNPVYREDIAQMGGKYG